MLFGESRLSVEALTKLLNACKLTRHYKHVLALKSTFMLLIKATTQWRLVPCSPIMHRFMMISDCSHQSRLAKLCSNVMPNYRQEFYLRNQKARLNRVTESAPSIKALAKTIQSKTFNYCGPASRQRINFAVSNH